MIHVGQGKLMLWNSDFLISLNVVERNYIVIVHSMGYKRHPEDSLINVLQENLRYMMPKPGVLSHDRGWNRQCCRLKNTNVYLLLMVGRWDSHI